MTLEQALQQLKIRRKAKRLQLLWPSIEKKVALGVSHADILKMLNENGFELSERTYKSYLYRYRKERRCKPKALSAGRVSESSTSGGAAFGRSEKQNTADLHKRPPTFDFDPRGDPDLLK